MNTKFPRAVAHQQRALAVIRICLGLLALWLVWSKLDPKWVGQFGRLLDDTAKAAPFGFYGGFLKEFVAPMGAAGAYMLLLAELVVGCCLVLGLFTAPAALLGALVALNYALASAGATVAGLTLAVVAVALAFAHAGTTWGLDRALVGKMPWWTHGVMHHETREF